MDSVSRVSTLLGTAHHNLTLDAASQLSSFRKAGGGTSTVRSTPFHLAQLKKLLDSKHEREVLQGLRQVIALSHRPPLPEHPVLFSSVLKNIASPSNYVKKLVYIHLLQHAESDPDTALLSINAIQKTLSHADPHMRALALRVMASIRVPVISQIVLLAIKKGCGDMSPLVRKAAAMAIPSCAVLDPNTIPQLEDFLDKLLGDRQYFVAGAAVIALMEVFGSARVDLVHKHYRSLVRKMVDMEEWGQIATLRLMLGYARRCFPPRYKKRGKSAGDERTLHQQQPRQQAFPSVPADAYNNQDPSLEPMLDPDLDLLLKSAQTLLQSRNSAVVVAVARLYMYLAPSNTSYLASSVGPLVALLRTSPAIRTTALYYIVQVALILPGPFARYATQFLLRSTDGAETWRLKLELLTIVFPHSPPNLQSLILTELEHFGSKSPVEALVRDCVQAVGRCAQTSSSPHSKLARRCMNLLMRQLASSNNPTLIAESLTVIRHLIQADPASHIDTVTRLAKNLDTMTNPQARASIIWLVGEFSAGVNGGNNIAADVLRILVKGFADEHEDAKLQIVLLAAKAYLHNLNLNSNSNSNSKLITSSPVNGDRQSTNPTGLMATNSSMTATSYDYTAIPETTFSSSPITDPQAESQTTQGGQEEDEGEQQKEDALTILFKHVLLLARYDTSYDLRDRSRLYRALLSDPSSTQLANLVLLAPKPAPAVPSPSESRKSFTLGSASLVVGAEQASPNGLRGYEEVLDWVEAGQEPDAALRDENDFDDGASSELLGVHSRKGGRAPGTGFRGIGGGGAGGGVSSKRGLAATAPVGDKTLDDWLAEEDDDDANEQDDESDDDADFESEETSEDEEDEEEDEEDETDESEADPDAELSEEEEDEYSEDGDETGQKAETKTLMQKSKA